MSVLGQLAVPIIQAPMAGGPSTPALAAAVSEAGGLGFLGAGYLTAGQLTEDIAATRALTDRPFGVNLFVGGGAPADPGAVAAFAERLAAESERPAWRSARRASTTTRSTRRSKRSPGPRCRRLVHVRPPVPRGGGPATGRRVGAVDDGHVARRGARGGRARARRADRAGRRSRRAPRRLRRRRARLRPHAAVRAAADPRGRRAPAGRRRRVGNGAAVGAALVAGASAAQVGTAYLRAPEAGTSEAQRAATAEPTPTVLTRAFSGRLARGITNRLHEHAADAPRAYPEVHYLTSPLRAHARKTATPT